MNKKLFTACVLVLLAVANGMQAGNTIHISSTKGSPGSTVSVSVSMDNTDAVSAMQIQIPMPDNCTLVEGSATAADRASNHSVTAGVKDGVLNLFVFSQSMATLSGTSGEVMTFKLKLGNQPSTTTLQPSAIILTNTEGNKVDAKAESGTVTVEAAKAEYGSMTVDFGRVPIRGTYTSSLTINNTGNAPLTVTALEFSAFEFSSDANLPLTIEAGGSQTITLTYAPTVRGEVSKTLKVVCNSSSKLNTITLKATPYAVNELHVDDASGIADSTVEIHLRMNNMDPINGFQFEFNMPDQLKYVDGSFTLSNRKTDHQSVASLDGSTLKLIAYSLSDQAFTGNDGEIASFRVKLSGQYGTSLDASKAILTATLDGKVTDVLSDKYGGYVNILSPVLSTQSELDMGRTPVTEDATATLTVNNYGQAPLTISRVVFDSLGFSVKETLPLTIQPYENKSLTVVYNGQTQSDFSSIMQLYCNDPNQRMWNVKLSGNRFAPNYVSMSSKNIYTGDTLKVDLSLSNYDPINGLQFDVSYPKDYFTPVGTVTGTDRTKGLSMQVRDLGNDTCRYFIYSLTNTSIAPGSGKICTIAFAPKADIPTGSYSVSVTKVKVGSSELKDKYAGNDFTMRFKVIVKTEQTITWEQKADSIGQGGSYVFEAKSSASMPMTYSIIDGANLVETSTTDGRLTVKALQLGTFTIRATAEGDSTHLAATSDITCKVYDPTIYVTGISLNKASVSLYTDDSATLQASISPSDATHKSVVWTSSDSTVARVKDGVITAIKAGTATITATASDGTGKQASCTVTVLNRPYIITYMVDGKEYKKDTVIYSEPVTPLAEPTREGYTFSGWSEIPTTMPAKDVTVTGTYTVNKYKLTYMVDGKEYRTDSIAYGTTLTALAKPTKEGYTFSGWSEIPTTMPAKDVTVTGTYTVNKYKLTYMVDGKEYRTDSIAYGTTLTAIAEPTKEGYTFSGWSEIPTAMPAKDVTVTGTYTVNKYKLTYMVDGKEYKTDSIAYGTTLTPLAEPTKEGYTFSGWSEIPTTMPAKDVVITGSFEKDYEPEDANHDGLVDTGDVLDVYGYMQNAAGSTGEGSVYDVNGDGQVDTQDVLTIYNRMSNE